MTNLVLSIGIAVTFLTVWGVIMVGVYLLVGEAAEPPNAITVDWVTQSLAATDSTPR